MLCAVLLMLMVTACGESRVVHPGSPTEDPVDATEPLPAPDTGFRWVSWRNVAVQVPQSWEFGVEPGLDWCATQDDDLRQRPPPYVDVGTELGGVLAIGCPESDRAIDDAFGPAPESLWATHLTMEEAAGRPMAESLTEDGWTLTTREIGRVRIRLLTDEAYRDETARVLKSARTFTIDQNGCAASSPVQAKRFVRPHPFDIIQIDAVESISICMYRRGFPAPAPALMASRSVVGVDAGALLKGLQEAPVGRGPEAPGNCAEDSFGDTGVVLRLNQSAATHDVHLYFDNCLGSGTDDGTTQRRLTKETCAPIFDPPEVAWGYSSAVAKVCGRS